jgi:hypothetical protein
MAPNVPAAPNVSISIIKNIQGSASAAACSCGVASGGYSAVMQRCGHLLRHPLDLLPPARPEPQAKRNTRCRTKDPIARMDATGRKLDLFFGENPFRSRPDFLSNGKAYQHCRAGMEIDHWHDSCTSRYVICGDRRPFGACRRRITLTPVFFYLGRFVQELQ